MIVYAAIAAAVLAFGISVLATPLSKRLAWRFGMLDVPGRHKAHDSAVPLLGGSAVFIAILAPSLLVLSLARIWAAEGVPSWLPKELAAHVHGAAAEALRAMGILAAAAVLHVVGIVDDRRNLGPWLKLISELAVCTAVVLLCDVRVLTVAGEPTSSIVSVLWLVVITNAFNFLDNMDGLSAGVALICAAALLAAGTAAGTATSGQVLISVWLCLMIGALAGFLPYNFTPASIFMGDAGALVVGFLLAVASCLRTYALPGRPYYLYGIFVPLVVMAVPLYDAASVVVLRIRRRSNPMVGDRRHFSHRLVRRGMSTRSAVLTIFLCTAATAVAASMLAHVDNVGAVLVFAQTIAILAIVALLEAGGAKP